ncbi:MAG: histidinol-phosphate transaminase [Candidatus Eisenbacteria bacterium]
MNRPLTDLVRPELLQIALYQPGKAIEQLQRDLGAYEVIKFASNENALGPSPLAMAAAQQATAHMHRYADAGGLRLRQELASLLQVTPPHVVLGCGSNELILLACQAFLRPGEEAVMHHPSFLMYPIAVMAFGGRAVQVDGPDHGIDLEAMLEAITPRTRMVFLCSPNNPTGDILTSEQLDGFLRRLPADIAVVLDEAYHEFANDPAYPNGIERVLRHPERAIVVLRTFSKAHGLASLRIGYGIMDPTLAGVFDRIRQPFDVNGIAQAAALASLQDPDQVPRTIAMTRFGLEQLSHGLRSLGVHVRPSHGNFLFCQFPTDVRELCRELDAQGLLVRSLLAFGLDETYARITVGLQAENERLLAALRQLLPASASA